MSKMIDSIVAKKDIKSPMAVETVQLCSYQYSYSILTNYKVELQSYNRSLMSLHAMTFKVSKTIAIELKTFAM